jgi:pyroglutamyl-peptidase
MRLLLTSFEPYDDWEQNSSWEVMSEYLRVYGANASLVTRRYPVDLVELKKRLDRDLATGFDAVLHLGQRPGASQVSLEAVAINVAGITTAPGEEYGPLLANGPVGYRTQFPLGSWLGLLHQSAIPSHISYHAGTYLCNAIMYLSHHWYTQHRRHGEEPLVGFVHLPLTSQQVLGSGKSLASMPSSQMVHAVALIVGEILAVSKYPTRTVTT